MGGMPLAAIITIAVIAGVIVLIVAVTFALRAATSACRSSSSNATTIRCITSSS